VRLKTELHAIIGTCAAVAFLVIGVTAWWEVRRVHLVEVEARGRTMALQLSRAIALAMTSPGGETDLRYLLAAATEGEEARVVSAVVYDRGGERIESVGATSREPTGPEEDAFLREVLALRPGGEDLVISQKGEEQDRFGPNGEAIFEFGAPVVDRGGERRGVLVLALVREPVVVSFARTVTFMILAAALFVALIWFILFKMLKGRILTPIWLLSEGIQRVRRGQVDTRVELARQDQDEIATLVHSFNDLIGVLVERDSLQARLEEANRLAEAHARLHEAHLQLKRAQEQLILNEKHASLGRLVHGLNHELNNPLSAAQNMIPPLEGAIRNLREELLQRARRAVTSPDEPLVQSSDDVDPVSEAGPSPAPEAEADSLGPDGDGPGPGDEAGGPDDDADAGAPAPAPRLDPAIAEDLADVESAVEVIARSVGRAINLVRDLGAFSRLGSADLVEVELQAVLDEAVQACQQELADRVEVVTEAPEVDGEPLRLKAFPNLLVNVFVNLVTNSSQAMGPSGGKVVIRAQPPAEGRVRIEVEDDGPGIPKDHLPKIFEPFFTTKEQGQGTGLGLAICLGFVEKHGGTIEARRRRRGALFVLELPLEPVVEERDPWASASFIAPGTSASAASAERIG